MTTGTSSLTLDGAEGLFDLSERVAIITGGAGLLGMLHASVLATYGARVVLLDLARAKPEEKATQLSQEFETDCLGLTVDITKQADVEAACHKILERFGRVDILINNAANNPAVEAPNGLEGSRLENLSLERWDADLAIGLTGAFICSKVFGCQMLKRRKGVILNIASDLAVISPDQRLYRVDGLPEDQQPVKPITYSVVKTALLGLTRYLAGYWSSHGIRVNAISPGGVFNGQPDVFTKRLEQLIPMGRMAHQNEYQGAILFLCSDASSYMTGHNLIIDGGRTCL
jgi:NAD(P)-dependent dehydrogenase (short-subunit alcohol dehydrogenase family)